MPKLVIIIAACLFPLLAFSQEWVEHPINSIFNYTNCIEAADINGDGVLDAVASATQVDRISWFKNVNGTGIVWSEYVIASDFDYPSSVFPEDVDGDGDIDIIGAALYEDVVAWWENDDGTGLTWTEHTIQLGFDAASSVYGSDLDQDGDIDVVGTATNAGQLHWWENTDGTGLNWQEHIVDDDFGGAQNARVIDLDADGDLDIVGAGFYADEIAWWENIDGVAQVWSKHQIDGNFNDPRTVFVADVDGDGDPDVLGAARTADDVTWWENLYGGGHYWTEHTIDGNFNNAECVHAADVDRDGDMDVLGAGGSQLVLWKNSTGDGTSWEPDVISNDVDGAWWVVAADMDADTDLDLLTAEFYDNDLTCWTQTGPYSLQVLTPNGGEVWHVGTSRTIEWISTAPEDVIIELLEGPYVEQVISTGTPNDGSFTWSIPQDLAVGNNYRIRLTLLSGEEQDISDGAFEIATLPTLVLTPHNPPIIITPNGDGFWYWMSLTNHSSMQRSGQYWTEVILPGGGRYGPLTYVPISLQPWETFEPDEPFAQWVPAYAPAGSYHFVMKAGIFPDIVVASDSFEFEKLAGSSSYVTGTASWTTDDWRNESWSLAGPDAATAAADQLPVGYTLTAAYPNPFNTSTQLAVDLPQFSLLQLEVFNITGQQVAELAHGSYQAGVHEFAFDATGLASGIYFVHATVAGQFNAVQKVMLVR